MKTRHLYLILGLGMGLLLKSLWQVMAKEQAENRLPPVRDAGPEQMVSPPAHWDTVDQQGDESFPASDPPGNY